MVRRAFVLGAVVAAIGVCAPPAWGAFTGGDGDLVVATGGGLELVVPGTGAARSICTSVVLCGHPAQPSFSPNGRAIAFADTTSHRPVVVAADGSCLWCLLGAPLTTLTGSEPAFTGGGQGVTVARNGLSMASLSGGGARRLLMGPVDGAVWSSRGLVALVRGGWIWVGRPGQGRLRRLARGRSPSFSPDGVRVALARDGYVWIVRVADGTERRLVRGGAPAWSPNGRRIAYIAAGGAVEIVAVRGGRSRHVGSVRGTALDWQPLPSSERHGCKPPRGSTVLASNREVVVFSQRGFLFSGCLKALGRTRLLLDASKVGYFSALIAVRLAGRFAVLEPEYDSPQYVSVDETLYDLSSGKATRLADVSWDWSAAPIVYGLDFFALDSSGFAAWRATTRPMSQPLSAVSCPSVSLCVAGDLAGSILSSTNPTRGPTAWNVTGVLSNQSILGVSCPSISLCVAVGSAGNVLTSTDPTGGASAWTNTTIGQGDVLDSVSCPSVSLCVAGGGGARIHGGATILTSTDPTGGASSWTSAPVASGDEVVEAVSCPSVSLCVATTNVGDVFTSTHPTGGASAWTKTTVDQGNVPLAVSCPSVSLCVAVDYPGNVLTSTHPTGGASAWKKIRIDQGPVSSPVTFTAVSCPSVALCVAGDQIGNIFTSNNPAGGASAWKKAVVDQATPERNSLTGVSCPSVSLCVAGDDNGSILTSTNPTGGANTWTRAAVDIPGCARQSRPCESEQLYARDDQGTRVVDTAPPGHGNSIGNVALGGDSLVLSWTHGAQRQVELR
jgi:hypothetical protein